MSSQSGVLFRIATFGESHGPGVGVVIDGCPAGIKIDWEAVQAQLARRRPGQSHLTTQRREPDILEVLSGIFEERSLGTPIAVLVRNTDSRSKDYDGFSQVYRPSHADYTYHIKYGHRTPHGGGRASVRETIGRVIAGSVAEQILKNELGMETVGWVDSIGEIETSVFENPPLDRNTVDRSLVRCPDPECSDRMIALVEEVKKAGDSVGGTVGLIVRNVPPGLGEPVFDKLEAELAKACLSIPACKGFESGSGFQGTRGRGSEHNDLFYNEGQPSPGREPPPVPFENVPNLKTRSNRSGGIQGGITNGMPITLRVAFKPTATIFQAQTTADEYGAEVELQARGRHDPCVLPRAVPIVESVVNLVLVDAYLQQRARNPAWWERYASSPKKSAAVKPK